ncbi:esterase B1-like [Chrysoperla carnea]|uniref:esterase B1-like n=1 Tax=Chrysoperla carnea TaxID=189513 RepID=UPI001D0715C7|nr:esterase B1-like [Chrysoperla carnea]
MLELEQGTLIGRIDTDYLGDSFYSFQSIPYAKPPIGDLRFKAPEPLEKWNGTWNATQIAPMCSQKIYHKFLGQEDCLYLNVYTKHLNPNGSSNGLTNVLFWIHGGFFTEGSGNPRQYGPHYLIHEDIVIVTINYRVGTFGFLSLPDTDLNIPGNAGLKDQLLALKWVEKNIVYFGGDKDRVTLGGNDAGAASVEYLMVSPKSRGLFNRVILQSGNSQAYWAKGKPHSIALAKLLEVAPKNLTERQAWEIINRANTGDILQAQSLLIPETEAEGIIAPIIESINSPSAIVTRTPQEVIEGKMFNALPYLTGYNSNEGIMALFYYKLNPGSIPQTAADFELFLPEDMYITKGTEKSLRLAQKIKEFYFGNSTPSMENIQKMFNVHTDVAFAYPVYKGAQLLSANMPRPVYMYIFSQNSSLNFYKAQYDLKNLPGACHYDELGYIFSFTENAPKIERGSDLEFYIKRMCHLWGNFIRLGNPNGVHKNDFWNVTWLPATHNAFNYMNIDDELVPSIEPNKAAMLFWDELYIEALGETAVIITPENVPDLTDELDENESGGAISVYSNYFLLLVSFLCVQQFLSIFSIW